MLVDLTQDDVNKIQIDEGIVVANYGEEDEKVLGPTRGGVEFTATPSIRDIEYDGRRGKTVGMQVKDGEDVNFKIALLCCSQENLSLAIPNVNMNATTKKIEQGNFGIIKAESYIKNIAVVTQMLDGTYKILIVKNVMHEGAFNFSAKPKSENEHNLELIGHYKLSGNDKEKIWSIEDSNENPIAA